MKQLVKYILYVFIGVTVIDLAYRLVCDYFYQHPKKDSFILENYTFIHCNTPYQCVILGASTAKHSYVSQQIEDSLNISTYNMGWNGRSVLYQYLSLMKAIKNGGLELAILNLSTSQMRDNWVKDRISDLYPYYWHNDTIREIVNEVEDRNMDILMCSSLIQFNSKLDNMLRSEKSVKGYIPIPYSGKPAKVNSTATLNKGKKDFNLIAVKYFQEMAKECEKNKVRFIVCLSPSLDTTETEIAILKDLCDSSNVEMWNMVHVIRDPFLFKDGDHLNEKGAELFTQMFIETFSSNSLMNK